MERMTLKRREKIKDEYSKTDQGTRQRQKSDGH